MAKKPVCFVTPPSGFLADERVFPNLGVLKVAASLEAAGVPVEVLDLSGISNYAEVASRHAASTDAVYFGVTATSPQMPAALRIAEAIKAARPESRLILGGPHVTLVHAALRKQRNSGRASRAFEALSVFDHLVVGDGEYAVRYLLLEGGGGSRIIDADDPKSHLFLKDADLTKLPHPARHLIDLQSYRYTIEAQRATSLIAQLGCPFECGFCGGRNSPFLRRVRMRSSESVVQEMTSLHATYGFTGFMLYDDELNVNRGMVELMRRIRNAQEELGVAWRLRGFVKAELFNKEQALALQRAGFRWILVGFESGSPQILRAINKKATREENARCMEIARRCGIKVKALMSIGHPGENPETIEETVEWLRMEQPDDFDLSVITPYPGTPYYDEAMPAPEGESAWVYVHRATGSKLFQREIDFTREAGYYKGDPTRGYQSFVWTDALQAGEIVALRNEAERSLRRDLRIPFPVSVSAQRYEHSMGQGGALPTHMLRVTGLQSLSSPKS
jgi:radical SAM superfamily enzyme YgiQ (UPF0313 family)